jgi:DNA-directed RNA polymerase specialized sigma24 family protein
MRSLITLAERNQIVVAYMPLAQRIARAFWGRHMALSGKSGHTQKRNSDAVTYDDLESAGYRALVQARDGWDPLLSNCNQPDCYLPSENGRFPTGIHTAKQLIETSVHEHERCPHGNAGYTFGAFAQRFIEGACIAALKKSHRRKPLPYTEELMACTDIKERDRAERPDSRSNEYERLPDYHPLQDGSEFDGSPSAIWSSVDMLALRKFIADAIESGALLVRGLSADQLRIIVANIGDGRSHAEVAGDACCKVSQVHAALSALRALLVETDYGDDQDGPRSLSLSELAGLITKAYPHDPCVPKRLGEWLMRGWVPGKQNADGRWFISHWGAKIAIKKWGERKSRGPKDLDTDTPSDKVPDMSRSKPARILRVTGHVGTALPEYSGAVIGPVVSIEVGQGRAQSCAVTSAGDKFYGRNREAVLQRFGLVQEGEDVRPGAQVPVLSPASAPSGPPTPSAGAAAAALAAPLSSTSANVA